MWQTKGKLKLVITLLLLIFLITQAEALHLFAYIEKIQLAIYVSSFELQNNYNKFNTIYQSKALSNLINISILITSHISLFKF